MRWEVGMVREGININENDQEKHGRKDGKKKGEVVMDFHVFSIH